jgi:hypothetical protein
MAICIKCGWNCEPLSIGLPFQNTGWKCVNPDCELNTTKKDENNWTLAEHKDNQTWAVRYIRALEAHVKELQTALDLLLKKLGV